MADIETCPHCHQPMPFERALGEDVLRAVSIAMSVPVSDIRGERSTRSVIRARYVAAKIMRNVRDMSLAEIGTSLGYYDQSSVVRILNSSTHSDLETTIDEIANTLRRPKAGSSLP